MNSKVLSILAVVVALLSAWLVVAMSSQPRVSMKSVPKTESSAPAVQPEPKASQPSEVTTKVYIPSQEVNTTVKIVPKKR